MLGGGSEVYMLGGSTIIRLTCYYITAILCMLIELRYITALLHALLCVCVHDCVCMHDCVCVCVFSTPSVRELCTG